MKDCVSFLVHDQVIAGPLNASNKSRAKGLVAEAALAALSDPCSPFHIVKICTCRQQKEKEKEKEEKEADENTHETSLLNEEDPSLRDIRERKLDLETIHGCALTGALRAAEADTQAEALATAHWNAEELALETDGNETADEQDLVDMLLRSSPFSTATVIDSDVDADIDDGRLGFGLSQASTDEVDQIVSEEIEMDLC